MSFQTKAVTVVGAASAVATVRQFGIAPVISAKAPTPEERLATQQLDSVLHARGLYESDEDGEAREHAIGSLNEMLQEWMREETAALGMGDPAAPPEAQIGKILTFGSFRLGVHGPAADMDTLVVGPHWITRAMFFEKFTKRLEERSDVVSELSARVDAYVPVITFKFTGIEFDLLYAEMSVSVGNGIGSTSFNIYDDQLLRSLDSKSVLSLNGARVTDMVLSLMPAETVSNFRMALRFIKLWAKNRGIYSNVFGYLGGVSWAILTAQVCQLYPVASASKLLEKFFQLYQQWKWPFPIFLNEPKYDDALGLQVWNPKENYRDKQDLMPIITPAYPAMNSTHNVSRATLKVLQSEFTRGHELFEDLTARMKKGDKIDPLAIWNDLLTDATFFFDHKDYLDIKVSSRREEDQLMWLGYVESKIRQLIIPLTRMDAVRTVPFPKNFTEKTATYTLQTTTVAEDGTQTTTQTQERLYVDHFFIGLEFDLTKLQQQKAPAGPVSTTAGTTVPAAAPVQLNLSDPVTTFRSFVFDLFSIKDPERSQRGFNCDVTHIKSKQLPEFVFKGEKRPAGWGVKKGKKRNAAATAAAAATGGSTPETPAAAAAASSSSAALSVPAEVKSDPSGAVKSEAEQDAKRAKLEHGVDDSSSSPPVKLEFPEVTKPTDADSDVAMTDAAAAISSELKSELLGSSVKRELGDAPTHTVHEMELALPDEPIVISGQAADSAVPSPPPPVVVEPPVLGLPNEPVQAANFIAAENVVMRTESEAAFEVVRRKAPQRAHVAIKISAAPIKSPTPPAPAAATTTASAATTPAVVSAPVSTAAASPPLASPIASPSLPAASAGAAPANLALSPAPASPPLHPVTPSKAAPPATPTLTRPGSFIKPVAPHTPGAGASRIQTSDDLWSEESSRQRSGSGSGSGASAAASAQTQAQQAAQRNNKTAARGGKGLLANPTAADKQQLQQQQLHHQQMLHHQQQQMAQQQYMWAQQQQMMAMGGMNPMMAMQQQQYMLAQQQQMAQLAWQQQQMHQRGGQ